MLRCGTSTLKLARFSFLYKRFISCNSCGVELQNRDPDQQGFYLTNKRERVVNTQSDIEKAKYMLFSQDIQKLKEGGLTDRPKKVESPPVCKRCNDALHQNKYDIKDFSKISYKDILDGIPCQSNLLHVVSFPEFPLGLNYKLLKNKNLNTSLVFTKADQVIPTKTILQKDVPLFLKDFLKNQLNITSNKAIAISSIKNWNIETLYSVLKSRTYLFGDANAGKSTLVNSLIKKYLGKRVVINKKGNVIENSKYEASNMKQYMKNNSAGVYHVPNMTRTLQAFDINSKFVYDLPGYSLHMDNTYLENIISKEWLQRMRKTELFDDKKLKKKHYTSFNGTENGACYTIGGTFFLVPPKKTINQIVKFIPGEPIEFANIDKALSVFNQCSTPDSEHPLKKYCGIKNSVCNKNEFVRHILPPFQGSIEIVIKDIGYLLLRTTGAYEYKGLYEIWLPKGIDMCIREPLEKTIVTGYQKYIESHCSSYSCPKDRPIVSLTYPMDFDEPYPLNKMREMYLERTSSDLSARRFKDSDPIDILKNITNEPQNLYWYYKW